MAAPAASPPTSLGFTCTNEELFMAFQKWTSGSPLPSNVIDVNPYESEPQNLRDDFWFLIGSKENIDTKHGSWKTKEEACEVFSNPDIIGWRSTLEYFEGQVPFVHKTDWVMQMFSITQKRLCADNEKKETSSLCRVFRVPSHEMQRKVPTAGIDTETRNHFTQPPVLDANSITRIGSLRNAEVITHDETEVLAVAERLPVAEHQGENLVDMEIFSGGQIDLFSGGHFLELQDLDKPASSSSSENSSVISFSSDDCFDSMAFLQELKDQNLPQNDAGKKLNVPASDKPDKVVIVPATLGSPVIVEGSDSGSDRFLRTAGSVSISASASRGQNKKVAKPARGDKRVEHPSSSSTSSSSSSESHSAAAGGRKRAGFGKKLRKKLCFMPC